MGVITNVVIGLIVVSGILTGFSIFYVDIIDQHGATPISNAETLAMTEEILNETELIRNRTQTASVSESDEVTLTFKDAIASTKIMLKSIDLTSNMIGNFAGWLKLPDWAGLMLIASFSILIIFFIIGAWLRYPI